MIGATVLNRSKPRTALLIHGLFATSGFWLPYLPHLKGYRLVLLDIDYRRIDELDSYLQRLQQLVAGEAGGAVELVLAHSLGCLLASRLPAPLRQASYQLCPVHGATRRQPGAFVEEIGRKARGALTPDAIRAQLEQVDAALARHADGRPEPPGTTVYIPDADPYFAYHAGPGAQSFHGDHFDIAAAMAAIGKGLAP